MAKRILPLFLILTVISGLISIPSYAEDALEKMSYSEEYRLLSGLGVIPVNFVYSGDEKITRGEFAQMVANMIGYSESETQKSYFEDLEDEFYATGAISYLYERGIVTGHSDGTFRADDVIVYDEAIGMLMKVMGYGEYVNLYKNSYFPVRNKMFAGSDYLTQDMALGYLVEAIGTDVCERDFYSDDDRISYVSTGETVLEHWRNISETEGLVTEVGYKGLVSGRDAESFVIGDMVLKTDTPEDFDCLGYYCAAYYYNQESEEAESLIYAYPLEALNNVTVIDAESLGGYSGGQLNYFANNRQCSVSILPETIIVKNFKQADTSNPESLFDIKNGMVTINKVSKENINVILIEEYKDYLVSSVSDNEYAIYTNNGGITLDEDGHTEITNADGQKMTLDKITANTLISVAQSTGSNVVTKIVAADKVFNGTLNYVSDKKIKVDSTEYTKSLGYSEDLSGYIGSDVTFYLNFRERVAYVKTDGSDAFKFGFLCRIVEDRDPLNTKCIMQIFNQSATVETLYASEKLKVDGIKCEGYTKTVEALSVENGDFGVYRPVRYKLNGDGEVSEIDTEYYNAEEGDREYTLQSLYKSYDVNREAMVEGNFRDNMWYANGSIGNIVSIDSATVALSVPAVFTDDYTLYKRDSFSGNGVYVDAYTAHPDSVAADFTVRYAGTKFAPTSSYLGVIENVSRALDEEENEVYQLTLTGAADNKSVYLFDSETDIEDTLVNNGNGYKRYVDEFGISYEPKIGDAVHYLLNGSKIVGLVLYYRPEKYGDTGTGWMYNNHTTKGNSIYVSGNTYNGTDAVDSVRDPIENLKNPMSNRSTRNRFNMGVIRTFSNGWIELALGEDKEALKLSDRTSLDLRSMQLGSGTKILKMSPRGEMTEITQSDIKAYKNVGGDCDRAIIITDNNLTMLIYVLD